MQEAREAMSNTQPRAFLKKRDAMECAIADKDPGWDAAIERVVDSCERAVNAAREQVDCMQKVFEDRTHSTYYDHSMHAQDVRI